MARVGVIGLGGMGSRIATRLLDAGHEVAVWNRDAGKAEVLVSAGAVVAATPAELAQTAEIVL